MSHSTQSDHPRSSQLNHLIQTHGFEFIARGVPEIWETDDLGWFWITGCALLFSSCSTRVVILEITWLPGQIKLKRSSVVVVGAGGLGCPALQYLAAAGIGEHTLT